MGNVTTQLSTTRAPSSTNVTTQAPINVTTQASTTRMPMPTSAPTDARGKVSCSYAKKHMSIVREAACDDVHKQLLDSTVTVVRPAGIALGSGETCAEASRVFVEYVCMAQNGSVQHENETSVTCVIQRSSDIAEIADVMCNGTHKFLTTTDTIRTTQAYPGRTCAEALNA